MALGSLFQLPATAFSLRTIKLGTQSLQLFALFCYEKEQSNVSLSFDKQFLSDLEQLLF